MKGKTAAFLIKTVFFSVSFIILIFIATGIFRYFEKKYGADTPTAAAGVTDNRPTVVLDAGHGGMDSGTVSVLGDEEKHINLSVVQKLGEFLEQSGIRVVYTRTEDAMLESDKTASRKMADLIARVDMAKCFPNATFVSIHMNALPIEKYKGLQVFYSSANDRSKVLALQIQNDTHALLQPDNNRKIKDAEGSIYILDRIPNPAVLVECGFLSNYEEAALLKNEEYQAKLAFSISRSLISFLLQKEN